MSLRITVKVANDLANLAMHAVRRLFQPVEKFDLVIAGGLVHAGDLILAPLKQTFRTEFPIADFKIGNEVPGIALGKLAIFDKEN